MRARKPTGDDTNSNAYQVCTPTQLDGHVLKQWNETNQRRDGGTGKSTRMLDSIKSLCNFLDRLVVPLTSCLLLLVGAVDLVTSDAGFPAARRQLASTPAITPLPKGQLGRALLGLLRAGGGGTLVNFVCDGLDHPQARNQRAPHSIRRDCPGRRCGR